MKPNIQIIEKYLGTKISNSFGNFITGSYKTVKDNKILNHLLLYKSLKLPTPLRIQSGCLTGDIFGDNRCDCHQQLIRSMDYINTQNNGLIIYTLEHDGRGRGTLAKMKVYALRDRDKIDSYTACQKLGLPFELRNYDAIAEILKDIGIKSIILLSKNENKKEALENSGIDIIETKDIF